MKDYHYVAILAVAAALYWWWSQQQSTGAGGGVTNTVDTYPQGALVNSYANPLNGDVPFLPTVDGSTAF